MRHNVGRNLRLPCFVMYAYYKVISTKYLLADEVRVKSDESGAENACVNCVIQRDRKTN